MYMTQLKLQKSVAAAPLIAQFLSSKYAEHQVLWNLAGRSKDARRDFLYRTDVTENGLELMFLSKEPFKEVAEPWVARVKEYQPAFREGQLLQFKLRASVTVDRARAGKRSERTDLVMEKYRELDGKVPVLTVAHAAAEQWLTARGENSGFRLIESSASNYQRITVLEKERPFKIPALDMEGIIEITDPKAFTTRQQTGFGKTRFAGLGLMLVKPRV
jgi:CRISPR system Cascade subunit CasE